MNNQQFIVIDGPDGSGKSTQVRLLHEKLTDAGSPVRRFRDPGDTDVGESIRELLLNVDRSEMTPRTETFLYMASRAQLVDERIRPALERGQRVLLDRYYYSTVAYQGIAGDVDPEAILEMAQVATGGLEPDRTILLDVPAEIGLERAGDSPDRMEQKGLDFHRTVRDGFRELAERFEDHTDLVDATESVEAVHSTICRLLKRP